MYICVYICINIYIYACIYECMCIYILLCHLVVHPGRQCGNKKDIHHGLPRNTTVNPAGIS